MEVTVKYEYVEGYLPTKRHRKLRYRDAEGETVVTVKEVPKEEAPVAFVVTGLLDGEKEYRLWNEKLWTPVMWASRVCGKKGLYPLEEFLKSIQYYNPYKFHKTKEEAIAEKEGYASSHLIIEGIVYEQASEPRYVINTFGLGHNHGGTSLFVTDYYNSNIGKNRYFNALEREKAIAEGKRIAQRRGDTKSVDGIGKYCNIKVCIPEAVHCNPQVDHGNGDPFLNKLDAMTEAADSVGEAAALAMLITAKEINK